MNKYTLEISVILKTPIIANTLDEAKEILLKKLADTECKELDISNYMEQSIYCDKKEELI